MSERTTHPTTRSQVGPHDFTPMRRWLNRKRCRACFVDERAHPVSGWTWSRPWGDKTLPYQVKAWLRP